MFLQTPSYHAATLIYVDVETISTSSIDELSQAVETANARTITFKQLISTPLVLSPVAEGLILGISGEMLASHVTAQSALDTSILEINVTWSDPETAATIANRIATEAISTFALAAGTPSHLKLIQVQPAVAPTAPITPNPPLLLGLAIFGGLLLGSALVLFRQGWTRTIYSVEQIEAATTIPILATARSGESAETDLIAGIIQTAKRFREVHSIALVSAGERPGKSVLSERLSLALGDRYTVVDSPARLGSREALESPDRVDSAVVVVCLGKDTIPGINVVLAQLELLAVPAGGIIVLTQNGSVPLGRFARSPRDDR